MHRFPDRTDARLPGWSPDPRRRNEKTHPDRKPSRRRGPDLKRNREQHRPLRSSSHTGVDEKGSRTRRCRARCRHRHVKPLLLIIVTDGGPARRRLRRQQSRGHRARLRRRAPDIYPRARPKPKDVASETGSRKVVPSAVVVNKQLVGHIWITIHRRWANCPHRLPTRWILRKGTCSDVKVAIRERLRERSDRLVIMRVRI